MNNPLKAIRLGYDHLKVNFDIRRYVKNTTLTKPIGAKNSEESILLKTLVDRLNGVEAKLQDNKAIDNAAYFFGGLSYLYTHLRTIIRFENVSIEEFLRRYNPSK